MGSLTDATLAQSQMLAAQNAYADSIANARSAAAVLAVATGRCRCWTNARARRWSAPLARRQPAAPRIGSARAARPAMPAPDTSGPSPLGRPAFPCISARVSASLAFQIVSVAVGWQIYELSGSALTRLIGLAVPADGGADAGGATWPTDTTAARSWPSAWRWKCWPR